MSILKDFQPFNNLPEEILEELQPKLLKKTYPKDSFVFTQGQRTLGYLFIVVSGLAEIVLRNEKGLENVVGLRHPKEFFGETVLLTGKRYPASVRALEDLTCYQLERQTFEQLLQTNQEFAGYFSHILTDRLRELYQEMVLEQSYETPGLNAEPFKQRVLDIMSSPVATCQIDTPINHIARRFTREKISSVVVTDANGKMLGLVTERDLIGKVLAVDSNPALVYTGDIMQKDPAALPPDAFFYQALLTMIKRQGKYIVVVEQGRPIGIVTIGDLTRARITSSVALVKSIDSARNVEELADVAKLMNNVLVTMVKEKAPANEISEVVAELNDSLTRRLLVLAEDHLSREGLGRPPVEYCWLTLGSGGRKEQTLSSDQDNAIIYAVPVEGEGIKVGEYFGAIAKYVVDGLEKCGFVKCPGNTMAINPAWCQSLNGWKTMVHKWTYSPNPDSTRQFSIFLDFRSVYGREGLAQELRDFTLHLFRIAPTILHHLAKDDLSHRVPLNLFKQVIVEKNQEHKDEVDLKKAACIHVVDCLRLFALREGITETNTLGRLNKLVQLQVFSSDEAEYFEAAIQSLMLFRVRENLRKLSLGKIPDNYINPNNLSKRQRSVLRESFVAVDRLQTLASTSFQVDGHL
ncbi:MAG: DUF294 nucleotidyltransferase-like domain-containing protein [Desulfitobacteriaceae bacterium]